MEKKRTDTETAPAHSASTGTPASEPPDSPSAFSRHRVTQLAKRQMNLLAALESKVLRSEKPGAIHDLRIASRRLQQILDLLYPKPRASKLRKIRRTLRQARRSLSAVRNCDVLLQQVEQNLRRKRLAHREVWTTFRDYLQEQREDRMRQAGRKLGRLNLTAGYLRVKAALAAAGERAGAEQPPRRDPAAAAPAPQGSHGLELRELLAQSLLVSWEALNDRVAQSQKEPAAETIHAVRIAAKKLRYLIEVMQALRVAGSDPALDWLRQLQRHLGDWHDLEIMEQTMIEMVARPKFLASHLDRAVETEKLVLRNRRVKQVYQDRFFELIEQRADWERLADWIHSFAGSGQPAETKAG
jgi:CHAD domain-containing protein